MKTEKNRDKIHISAKVIEKFWGKYNLVKVSSKVLLLVAVNVNTTSPLISYAFHNFYTFHASHSTHMKQIAVYSIRNVRIDRFNSMLKLLCENKTVNSIIESSFNEKGIQSNTNTKTIYTSFQ